jgi:hypothetical protein
MQAVKKHISKLCNEKNMYHQHLYYKLQVKVGDWQPKKK